MIPVLQGIEAHIVRNLPEYLTFAGGLAIAAVCVWPEKIPTTAQEWWTWARDTFQTAVPAARNHQNPTPDNPDTKQEKKP